MAEGISENLPPKKPGIVRRITWAVKERLPWDPIGKKKRSILPIPKKDLPPIRETLPVMASQNEVTT